MLEVKNIQVVTEAIDRLTLMWEIEDTHEDVHDYLFTIRRSLSPGGPWDEIAQDLEDRYQFSDTSANLKDRWRQFYYQIVVTLKSDTSKKTYTTPVGLAAPPDLIALEVQRREALYFRKYVGRKILLFPRRNFGHRCNCWDSVLQRKKTSRCQNCFGTGYMGGYMSPILTWFQIDPSAKSNQQLKSGETQQVVTIARTMVFPRMKPKDIIVERENKRWRIVRVMQTERLRAVVRHELHLSAISPGSIEFELPVDFTALEDPVDQLNFRRVTTL